MPRALGTQHPRGTECMPRVLGTQHPRGSESQVAVVAHAAEVPRRLESVVSGQCGRGLAGPAIGPT